MPSETESPIYWLGVALATQTAENHNLRAQNAELLRRIAVGELAAEKAAQVGAAEKAVKKPAKKAPKRT